MMRSAIIAIALLASPYGISAKESTQVISVVDAILDEESRTRSSLLMLYQDRIKPIAEDEGIAQASYECRLRSEDWRAEYQKFIDRRLADPALIYIRSNLSRDEQKSALTYYADNAMLPVLMYRPPAGRDQEEFCKNSILGKTLK